MRAGGLLRISGYERGESNQSGEMGVVRGFMIGNVKHILLGYSNIGR